jgi:phosphatidyl-myo-inositol alpha-mannosyltransferase
VRVAVVCPYDLGLPGGVQDQTTKLTGWLIEAGHEAWLVGPGTTGPDGARLLGQTIGVRANGSVSPIALDPRSARRVASALDGADVVHVHEPLMPLVGIAAARVSRVPVVGTFHADPSSVVRSMYRLSRAALRSTIARLRIVTAVSRLAAEAVAPFAAPRIVPNAVDLRAYREGGDADRAAHRVVFVGRDEPRKGLDVLLEAWPNVRRAVRDAELVVAGANRPDQRGTRFLGRIGEADKQELLRSASVFVAPNLGGESFGITLVEAMAAGCAVVASGLRAFAAVAGDGAAYAPPGDASGLAAVVTRVLDDPSEAARLRSAASSAIGSYDVGTVFGEYVAAYEEALAS